MKTKTEAEGGQTATGDAAHEALPADAAWCQEIADRIGSGDTQAEAELIARMRPGLLVVLHARCLSRDLAADLCQDTLIIVLNRLRKRSIADPSRLAGFAAQTARQLAFDERRRYAVRRTTVSTDLVEATESEAPIDDSADRASVIALVRRLVAELSHDRDREILRRFYLLEQEKSEICRSFGLAPGAFDQLIFRARARLRALLDMRGLGGRDLLCVLSPWVPKSWLS